MNDNNLIRFDQMTPEQHKELSRRGGVASGEKRRLMAEYKRLRLENSIQFLKNHSGILCNADEEKAFRAYLQQRKRKARKKREKTGQ